MERVTPTGDPRIAGLIESQSGVVTTSQALGAGLAEQEIRENVDRGRWRRLWKGVYATFTGQVPRNAQLWATVLAAGSDAVLSHETAAELAGLAPEWRKGSSQSRVTDGTSVIHVTIPERRKVAAMHGVVIHRSSRVAGARHPVLQPPRTSVEETIIDLTQTAGSMRDAFGWLSRAVNAGLTTAQRLLAAMAGRPKLRWRRPLREALGDVHAGCRSVLEISYLRDVERDGLPTGERQSPVARGLGRIYLDVRYRGFGVTVELDGRAAHPDHQRWQDRERDNLAAERQEAPLRYGTPDVWDRPCRVAAQVSRALHVGGWVGPARRCTRGDCTVS